MKSLNSGARILLALAGLLLPCLPDSFAQQPPPTSAEDAASLPLTTLKIGTKVVAIAAVVRNKHGDSASGLTREDFLLKQDGKEVPIRYFSQGSELPLTLALLVDTSGSQRTFIGDEIIASDVFFAAMLKKPEDRAMLVQFDSNVLKLQTMTNSVNKLRLSLRGLDAPHASAMAAGQSGTMLYDAIYAVSKESLAKEAGRKAMVLLTDGNDVGSRLSLEKCIEQAQRADVAVYSILYSATFDAARARGSGIRPDAGRAVLEQISEATGGRVFTVSNATPLREIFSDIANDLRLEYELGYTPAPGTTPNTFHKLDLKAADKKLIVQARKGFYSQP